MNRKTTATPKNPSAGKGTKLIVLIVLAVVGGLLLSKNAAPAPAWGEPGYQPKIGDECRSVWASINVDAEQYVRTVCSAAEQHEIAGWRPAAD